MATPGTYNGPTARLCAELSNLVYKYPADIRQGASALVANAEVTIRNGPLSNGRTVVVSGEKEIFVIFRGTDFSSVRSIFVNIRFVRTHLGAGLVHRGFLSLGQRAQSLISQAVREAGPRDLYFIGHSQGGAAAYLAAMMFELRSNGPAPSAVYTFGQPRAGNAQFSQDAQNRLKRRLSRIVNGADAVPDLPPRWLGYDHTDEYLHYGRNGLVSRRNGAAGQGWLFRTGGIKDHRMLHYLHRSHVNELRPPV